MRRIRLIVIASVVVALVASMLPGNAALPTCADAAVMGCWDAPFSESGKYDAAPPQTAEEAGEFPTAVSAAVMPNGQIVYWDGLTGIENSRFSADLDCGRACDQPDRSRILDLDGKKPVWLTPRPESGGAPDNMFCADQRLLASGELIVAGGTKYETHFPFPDPVVEQGGPAGQTELYGSENVRLFNTAKNGRWDGKKRSRDMHFKRWYPTLITLGNGKLLVAGGVSKLVFNSNALDERATDAVPRNVPQTETYNPRTQRWTENGPDAEMSLPLFARMHLLPNGHVFYGGTGQMYSPAGEDVSQMDWNFMRSYDPKSKTWTEHGVGPFGARSGAFQALLPLEPPYDSASFLLAGGTLGTSPGTYVATPLVEQITVAVDGSSITSVASESVAQLSTPRWYSSGVVLPNGHVLALNGGDTDDVVEPGTARAIRTPEIWDGTTWTPLASGARDRVYHNSALLLPDGSVLVGGHSPISRLYGQSDGELDDVLPVNNNLRDPSFERFYPPYLYAGPRPKIADAPGRASYGDNVMFRRTGGAQITKVALSRLPSVTHTTDADQRTVVVNHKKLSNNRIRFSVPNNNAVVPPGFYYVFALSAKGVPSVAEVIRIS